MGFGYLLLIIFGAYAAMKFYASNQAIKKDASNRQQAPPGVSYYCNLAVTHRYQQTQAFAATNLCQSVAPGFAPAFGPTENMPCNSTELYQ